MTETPPLPLETLAAAERAYWVELRSAWPDLPPALRRSCIRAAATALHALWRERTDLERLSPELWAWTTRDGNAPRFICPPTSVRQLARPMNHSALVHILADWSVVAQGILSPEEQILFLRSFLRSESVDPPAFRHAARRIRHIARLRVAANSRRLYTRFLSQPSPPGVSGLHGFWKLDPRRPPREIGAALEQAEADPATQLVKNSLLIRVMRGRLWGVDVMIKRFELPRGVDRFKYYLRPSRARRAWAAGETLRLLQIPTPESLGYFEVCEGRLPVRSYWITAFLDQAPSVYRWTKMHYKRQPESWRAPFRRDVMEALLALYNAGIYHADTKTPNLLVTHAEDEAQRKLYWTDLESMTVGTRPSRHQVVRNLVQLNGSVRHWVPDAERFAFLEDFAHYYPWSRDPRVIARIRRWTRRRLLKEVRRHTPPEGAGNRGA